MLMFEINVQGFVMVLLKLDFFGKLGYDCGFQVN